MRFIHDVQSANVALLRQLEFRGGLTTHNCRNNTPNCKGCNGDIVQDLHIYASFMVKFCTGLHYLTLNIYVYDDNHDLSNTEGIELFASRLRLVIEYGLCLIPNLKRIRIRLQDWEEDQIPVRRNS